MYACAKSTIIIYFGGQQISKSSTILSKQIIHMWIRKSVLIVLNWFFSNHESSLGLLIKTLDYKVPLSDLFLLKHICMQTVRPCLYEGPVVMNEHALVQSRHITPVTRRGSQENATFCSNKLTTFFCYETWVWKFV